MTTKMAAIGSRVLRLTNRGSSDVDVAATWLQYAPPYPSLQLHMHVKQHISFKPSMGTGIYSATSNNMKLVHWPLMGGL